MKRTFILPLIMVMMLLLGACDGDGDNNNGSGGSDPAPQTGQVTNITASVNPTTYNGLCPKTFEFTGVITVDGPCEVTYRWVHVPYVHEEKTITFTAAGTKTVKYSWSVGNGIPDNEHWLDLIVSAPNPAPVIETVSFDLDCVGYISGRSVQIR